MKNLIHEIHRRSLWQVLGIYLAVSWVVLQVVDVVGNNFGLPDWVAPAALVLLLLGLPVVIATAFVQEGMTAKEFQPPPQSLAEAGEVAPSPAPEPETHHRLLTWRNALLGGGAAFVLLAILTGGYLFMRSSGIGPAGTLVAQGVLAEGAPVVVADFGGSDEELAGVVTGALRIDLFQSPTIRVVEPTDLSEALVRMQRSADTRVDAATAREIAIREGYAAVIEGEIGTVGSGHVLTARIVGGPEWGTLAAFRQESASEDELLDAIGDLSHAIRDKAGESLRAIRSAPPLREVSTASLEALRIYTRAESMAGDESAALALFERATELDPEFAMAHRKVAVALGNLGIRAADQAAALERAYELRDRLPERERYLAEADYQELVLGDRDAAILAFENLLEIDPDNEAALNNLGLLRFQRGQYDEAEGLFQRAVDARQIEVGYLNLARVRISLDRMADAQAILDSALVTLPQAEETIEDLRIGLLISSAAYDEAGELADGFATTFAGPRAGRRSAQHRFALAAVHGRLADAYRETEDFDLAPGFFAHPMVIAANRARISAARGDERGAVSELVTRYAAVRDTLEPADRIYGAWLPTLIEVGGATDARRIYEEWKGAVPPEQIGAFGRDDRRRIDALLATAAGDGDEAVRLWNLFERECPGVCKIDAAYGRAKVHDRAGRADDAIREYEAFLSEPLHDRLLVDIFGRAPTLERLAQLYDETGDAESAAARYAAFVELWADADPVLQPRVAAARTRLGDLRRAAQ
ncbi:MAG: tetratricopeptide repeat protein [Gemmatimonadota bacterium]|nr:tetratricopeptide repeat protein [Gemmatimonadota bacterium]